MSRLVGLVEDGDMAGHEPDDYWAALPAWSEALEELWATQAAPSPGGWSEPGEPPQGIVPRLDRVPWWVRVWYHTPFLDRSARAWMWSNGVLEVIPRSVPLPSQPEHQPVSAASVVLPLSGEGVYLGEMRWEDPEPGLVSGVGGTRLTNHPRRLFNQSWASHVYGVRPTPAQSMIVSAVSGPMRGSASSSARSGTRPCASSRATSPLYRSSRWRLRRSRDVEVVYGPAGVWAAETVGRWDVVEVSHAGQTHRTDMWPGRLWELAFPRRKHQAGRYAGIQGPGEASDQ